MISKYAAVFRISLTQELHQRASFIMDRARSITILIAFYAFWSAIFKDHATLAGYTREEMFTYILGMNILRALIFSDKTWDIIREINMGKISTHLIQPLSYIGFCMSRDFADKVLNFFSAILEVCVALWILKMPLVPPASGEALAWFLAATTLAMALFFLMSYAVSALAFWTAESAGPRFCFELFLEFASGAFFPLNILPAPLLRVFEALPFASLLYFPINIYLGKAEGGAILTGIGTQIFWIAILSAVVSGIWQRGLKIYSAEGG